MLLLKSKRKVEGIRSKKKKEILPLVEQQHNATCVQDPSD
jgi:hypothetical protein